MAREVDPGTLGDMVIDFALVALAVVILLAAALIVFARRNPERFTPVIRLLMRSGRIRRAAEQQMVSELAADPQLLEEAMSRQVGKSQARQAAKMLGHRSEAEREELLGTLFEKAEAGESITLEDLARKHPRTADEARARAKRKDQARAKRKAAKRQKRR